MRQRDVAAARDDASLTHFAATPLSLFFAKIMLKVACAFRAELFLSRPVLAEIST